MIMKTRGLFIGLNFAFPSKSDKSIQNFYYTMKYYLEKTGFYMITASFMKGLNRFQWRSNF